jgi:hypothetical protein
MGEKFVCVANEGSGSDEHHFDQILTIKDSPPFTSCRRADLMSFYISKAVGGEDASNICRCGSKVCT